MPDGVVLAADLYLPSLPSLPPSGPSTPSLPLILVQSPYGRSRIMSIFNARVYASRGYPVLFVSCRGTFDSGGSFDPGRCERADSQHVVRWMRTQEWYPGRFLAAGASYSGYAAWALLYEPPEDCVGAVIAAAMHDLATYSWGTGALAMQRVEWSDLIVNQEQSFPGLVGLAWSRWKGEKLKDAVARLPLMDSVLRYFDGKASWLREWSTRPDIAEEYWEPARQGAALDRVRTDMPILLVMGWYDTFTRRDQTMQQYRRLTERGCKVSITIGPWGHAGASGLKSMRDMIEFMDGNAVDGKSSPRHVKVFLTGEEEWQPFSSWPPVTAPRTMHLGQGGDLSLSVTGPGDAGDQSALRFTYDPADPTPTIDAGATFTKLYATRDDVLSFTSAPLDSDLDVLGRATVQLAHSSDNPHVDLCIRLSEHDPRTGISRALAETYQAMDPNRDSSPLRLSLSDCAHRFRKGTCVQLTIAGGSFPMFARNLGVEGNRTTGDTMRPACHTIGTSQGISQLTLPVREGNETK
jgi:putative CocE/NonD family hydrolase